MEQRVFQKLPLSRHIDEAQADTAALQTAIQARGGLPSPAELESILPAETSDTPQAYSSSPSVQSGLLPPARLRPMFERAAESHGVPLNILMAMAQQESSYNPMARNGDGSSAKGIMQYVDGTARKVGINPYDPSQAIDAAARQIRARLDAGGTMEQAVMGHHAGDGAFGKRAFNASDVDYARSVVNKAAQIGNHLLAELPKPAAEPQTESANYQPRPDLPPVVGMDRAYFKQLQNQYDALNPRQAQQLVASLGNRNDINARALRAIAEQRTKEAATITDLSPMNAIDRTVALATGQGRAVRAAQYAAQGLNAKSAEALAMRDAMIGANTMQLGEAKTSGYDFDTRNRFKDSNALTRGVAKGAIGVEKAINGALEYEADLVGLDAAAQYWRNASNQLRRYEEAIGERAGSVERNLEGAVGSLTQQLPLLLTGAEGIALAGMAMQSFGQEYSDGRAAGQDAGKAAVRSSLFSALEMVGEKFGLGDQLRAIKAAAKGLPSDQILDFLAKALVKEVPGELLTTTGQFATDKLPAGVGLNTESGMKEYLGQVSDTVLQTFMQTGLMAGGTTGASKAIRYMRDRNPENLSALHADRVAEQAKHEALAKWEQGLGYRKPDIPRPARTAGLPVQLEPTIPSGPLSRAAQKSPQPDVSALAADLVGSGPVNQEDLSARLDAFRPAEEVEQEPAPQAAASTQELAQENNGVEVAMLPEPEPVQSEQVAKRTQPAEPLKLEEMDEPALRERLKYVAQQGKTNGWTKPLTQERKRIEAEINKRTAAQQQSLEIGDQSGAEIVGEDSNREAQQIGDVPILPADLSGAKPRYSYGKKQFDLTFANDIDKAAYIASQKKPSKRDADYVQFVAQHTGMSEQEIRAHGQRVRDSIKSQAKDAEPGMLTVAKLYGQQANQEQAKPQGSNNGEVQQGQETAQELKPFTPTHETPYGDQVAKINGEWQDAEGTVYEGEVSPIQAEPVSRPKTGKLPKASESATPASPQEMNTPTATPETIRTKSGKPFGSLGVAKMQAGKHPGFEPVQVEGGWELRKTADVSKPTEKIDISAKPVEKSAPAEHEVAGLDPDIASDSASLPGVELSKAKERLQRVKREGNDLKIKAAETRLRKLRQAIFDAEDWVKAAQNGDESAIQKLEEAGFADTADSVRSLLPRSESQAVNDFLDGKREEAPTVEEVKAEQKVEQNQGSFGPIFSGYTNKPEDAISKLMREKTGEVPDAYIHPDLGPIAFVYGDEKMGLRHIEAKRGTVFLDRIPSVLRYGKAERDSDGLPRAYVIDSSDPANVAVIRLDWNGKQKTWLVTIYQDDWGKFSENKSGAPEAYRGEAFENSRIPESPDTSNITQQSKKSNADNHAEQFAGNKIFTADKVAAARERMRKKLGQLNSGLDPELMIDGMTIAGAYIESGVRSFNDYAKAMIDDMGNGIKPYLLSFWEGARNYPGLNTEGMTSAEESAKQHAELNRELPAEVAEALGSEVKKPAKRTKKTGAKSDMILTQDWGVDHIDGYGDHYERETGNSVKDQFLKESAKYLAAIADKLQESGFVAHEDKKGRLQKPVSTNEAGPAVSGDVTLTMRHPDMGVNVYVQVGGGSLRGVVPTTQSGVSVMFRVSSKQGDQFATSGTNRWSPVDLSAADLTNMVLREVAGQENAMTRPAQPGSKQNADIQPTEKLADRSDEGRQPGRVQADGAREQAGSVSGKDDGPVRAEHGGSGKSDLEQVVHEERSRQGSADQHGDAGSREDGTGASRRGNPGNYRISEGELKRVGSWKSTAEQNVKIVETVKQILAENRAATEGERALLTKFTGWGASEIANGVFPNQYGQYKDASWKALGERLQAALTPEEYAQAKRTTQYAHYTSEPAIRSVYAALQRMGFNGGKVMEPGMGVGLFNGLMPDGIAKNSQYTGIEYDTITGNIAKLLYPDSNIVVGDFTQTKLPHDFFDVAIGNPPFGNIKILGDAEYKKHSFLLHDYFFAKTIDRVKPGGLLVFVTSKGTMDKANDRARKYLAERADLVGAIRMPQTAFKDNAGTEVVTDVIFLRKRLPGEAPAGESWAGLKEVTTPQGPASINEYFADHPEMVLGEHALTGSMYRANEYTVIPKAGDIEQQFAQAIKNLPENIYRPGRGSQAERVAVQRRDFDPKVKKEGGLYVADDGTLMQVENGQGVPLTHRKGAESKLIELKPKEVQFLKDWTGVRDALKQAQYDQLNDGHWQDSLDKLNQAYDAFVAKHGELLAHSVSERENEDGTTTVTKRFKNHSVLREDVESALANAIESVNESDNSISKGPVLLGRTINKPQTARIETTQDAMFVSLNEVGALDLAHVAKLAGKSEKEVIADLGNAIYRDPSGAWTTADDYLSGNVVRKLKEAEAAARLDKDLQRNVDALKEVQPKALAPQDIAVQLGSHWIPASDVQQFAKEALESHFEVSYSPITGQWNVEGRGGSVSEWSAKGKDASDILEAVLNNRQIKITYKDSEGKVYTDAESTEKANDVAKKMREAFKKWIWSDSKRADRLATFYNENYNNIAPRTFDGSHLTLPGVSARFSLRDHQKRAIWRTIQQGDTYYAHAVGAGKTFTMIAAGMEERRLGLSKKPMYVVPNHMLAQFSKEFLELYPTAQIMVADEQNFHTHNRRKFIAQAALNDPDAIIITHSAFSRIGMSKEFTQKFIQEQIAQWQAVLDESDSGDRITRKQIERRIEQLENRLKAIIDNPKDQLMNFEDLGVDRLFVDEAHEFRKLDFATNRGNIKGIDPSGSQRAMDLFMKVQHLREKNPGRALVMASGTPVTNTMGELYTVQRFFDHKQMAEDGDSNFDAWSNHYGEVVDGLEQNAAGGYESVSRFAKFVNVPELMSRVRSFMDILTSDQLGDVVQRPDVKTGSRQIIVTPVPDGFKAYQKELEQRIQAIKNRRGPPKPGDDIILSVIADGRFSAIDMRFVDPTLPSDPNSKLNRIIDDMLVAYHESANNEYSTGAKVDPIKGASMMLFTDIGLGEQSAANRGFNMKAWIEQRLVEGGVDPAHIAFMRDNKAHAKKERLFEDLRQGRKRILIGGKDMETGVNAQKRLAYLFHLDAPWFPASVEQREGRIIRQGNQNAEVDVRGYATKGSYDSTMWGMNARKQRFIEQAMRGDSSMRSMEDVSEASAFEMAAALASGDERYLKLAGLKGDVDRLARLHSAHMDEQRKLAWNKQTTTNAIAHNQTTITALNAALAKRELIRPGEFKADLNGKTYNNRDEFSQAAFDAFKSLAAKGEEGERVIGKIGGMDLQYVGVHLERSNGFAAELRVDVPGENDPLLAWPLDPATNVPGIATRAANRVNGLDRQLQDVKGYLTKNQSDLDKIERRLGAAFPEQTELNEKKQELAELESELAAESKEASAEAAAATLEVDPLADQVDADSQASGPAILSTAAEHGVVPERQRLSEHELAQIVEDRIGQFAHQPPVFIRDSLLDVAGDAAVDDRLAVSGATFDGKIFLFRSGIASRVEAVRTLWHELLHYGLRRFLSEEKYISEMNKLYARDSWIQEMADSWIAAGGEDVEWARKRGDDYLKARGVDEALADLAEQEQGDAKRNNLLEKTRRFVLRWVAGLAEWAGFHEAARRYRTATHGEARQLIQDIFRRMENNEPPRPDKDLTRSMDSFTSDPTFRKREPDGLTLEDQTRLAKLQGQIQDSMERVHKLQKQIEKVAGSPIKEESDYYGAETNRPGRIAARLEEGQARMFEPLVKRLAESGNTMADLESLLHAMHAKERFERLRKLGGNEDKTAKELVGMSLEEAAEIQRKFESADELHAIANDARKITRVTMDMRKQYGLISEESYKVLTDPETSYDYYVPLKGDNEYGPRVKKATGHGERDEHILENIFRDYELVVVAGEKNLARQSLLSLAMENPDSELWTVGVLPKGRTVVGDSQYTVKYYGSAVGTFRSLAEAQAFVEGDRKGRDGYSIESEHGERVHEYIKPLQDNEVPVYINGEMVRVQIHDPVLASQIRPMDGAKLNVILDVMRRFNRWLAAVYTGYNPLFILRNAVRDAMTGTINMVGNEGLAVSVKAWKHYPAAIKAMAQFATTRQDPIGEMGKYLHEYRMHGGKTGASYMSDLEEQAVRVQRLFEDARGVAGSLADGKKLQASRVAGRKMVGGMAHIVEVANQATENALRLALFVTLRKQGVSPGEAARAAKNVTVNFDRKGKMTPALGAFWLFFNPAVQGTANMLRTLAYGKHKHQAWALVAGLAALGVLVAQMGMDDDEDRWLGMSWSERTRNFILQVGKHTLRLPLSQEYAPFYAFGVAVGEVLRGQSAMKASAHMVSSMLETFLPLRNFANLGSDDIGADSVIAILPTIAQAPANIAFNRNGLGSNLMPDAQGPNNQKMFPKTKGSTYDKAAQFVSLGGELLGAGRYQNDISKVSPEALKYLWRTYTGGLGQFIFSTADLARMGVASPSDIEIGEVPLVNDFVRNQNVRPIASRFHELRRDADDAKREFSLAKRAGDGEEVDRILDDEGMHSLIRLSKWMKKDADRSKNLRNQAVEINLNPDLTDSQKREQLKAIEHQEEGIYREAIKRFKEEVATQKKD